MDLIQGNYHFEKTSQFGGYMNTGVYIMSYKRDYTIRKERQAGKPNFIVEEETVEGSEVQRF